MARAQCLDLLEKMLGRARALTTPKGRPLRKQTDILRNTGLDKRASDWGFTGGGDNGRSISKADIERFIDLFRDLYIDRSHWADYGYNTAVKVFDEEDYEALSKAFSILKYQNIRGQAGGLYLGQALDRLAKINAARRVPFATRESGAFIGGAEAIVAFLKEEMDSRRAVGFHNKALGIGKAFREGVLARSNPWRLTDHDRFQVTAEVCARGHWGSHQAGFRDERIRYLKYGNQRYGSDSFYHLLGLAAEGYDNETSLAPYKRLKIMRDGVESQVKWYRVDSCDLFEAAYSALRSGTHPDDSSNTLLLSNSPHQLLKEAIERNYKAGGSIEDIITETSVLAEGYSMFGNYPEALRIIEEADRLIHGNEESLRYRRMKIHRAKIRIYREIYKSTSKAEDADKVIEEQALLVKIEAKMPMTYYN